ncbi:latent-transforming growth factor beta-binding protein 1-like, partial [Anarrhichthys ocellatus]|uniref:latent-transforming growth factor beta-binding protein 1-like n=1 Tax=Anarrhichthys ocellatus TaxID=433405 RepID=UPI0012ED0136
SSHCHHSCSFSICFSFLSFSSSSVSALCGFCVIANCIPQCQNGGMCLRPQLCVCNPGSKGTTCEQKTVATHPFPALPGNGPTNGHTSGNSNGHTNGHNMVPQRPIPQQVLPNGYNSAPPPSNMAQMKLSVKSAPQLVRPHYIQQHIQQQIRPMHPGQSHQYVIKPKYYHTHTTHTQAHVQSQPERPIPLTVAHNPIHVGNHTGRIKVVFTPTICKLTCIGGRCHNNCELGNTTTIISENGHATDTLTAPNFRVVVCHLPCINGGKCSTRDKCQCPPNFTGKFCQMPVQNGHQQHQQTSGGYRQTQVHSTHTLPLTYSNGQNPVFNPSIVNIHIKHPPEASVQVHQVSQLDNYHNNGQQLKGSQSGSSSSTSYTYHHTESSQKIQHHGYNIVYPSQHGYQLPQYQPVTSKNTLGRCFQETAGSQCGKALPGLTKQEQCCGTIGTSWGFHKCQNCPKKPSIPLIDCPQGYKRINSTHCQGKSSISSFMKLVKFTNVFLCSFSTDVNECELLSSVCGEAQCVNVDGSFLCMCPSGQDYNVMIAKCEPVPTVSSVERKECYYRLNDENLCESVLISHVTLQECCCTLGAGWGDNCEVHPCPVNGTDHFNEMCPSGRGFLPNGDLLYGVPTSDSYKGKTKLLLHNLISNINHTTESFVFYRTLLVKTKEVNFFFNMLLYLMLLGLTYIDVRQ